MTSPNVIPLHPRHYQRGNVTNLHGATVTRLSEHLTPVQRADLHSRQARKIAARSADIVRNAFEIGRLWRDAVLVAHTQQGGAKQCAILAEKVPEEFREPPR